jgi:hypothetical protein
MQTMTASIVLAVAIFSYTATVLVPVLTRYPGCVSGKVSLFGFFKAESTVDGRKTEDQIC